MEGEFSNFIIILILSLISVYYCYIITKLVLKGALRFLMFLPVICLFFILPLNLKSINLILLISFFITWLTTFKLLLLAFGSGPLSDPSLSMAHFVSISCLPIKLKHSPPIKQKVPFKKKHNKDKPLLDDQNNRSPHTSNIINTYKINLRSILLKKGSTLIFLIGLGCYKDKFSRNIVLFLICMFVYFGLEVILGVFALIGQALLGTEVEPPFNEPYLSTSLQDFWGRRWNRVSSSSLRWAVYDPTIRHLSRSLGRKWAKKVALVSTFIVSYVMHDIIFYYSGRVKPGLGTPLFFLIQGLCIVIEVELKNKINATWQLPQIVMGLLVFGFVICNFMWLVVPELLEYNVDDRLLQEYAAMGAFVKDLGLALVQSLRPNTQ